MRLLLKVSCEFNFDPMNLMKHKKRHIFSTLVSEQLNVQVNVIDFVKVYVKTSKYCRKCNVEILIEMSYFQLSNDLF